MSHSDKRLAVRREFRVRHPDDGVRRLPHKAAHGYRLGEGQRQVQTLHGWRGKTHMGQQAARRDIVVLCDPREP